MCLEERRIALGELAGTVCPVCRGEMIPPTFHHTEDNKKFKVSSMLQLSPRRIFGEVNKCIIMCRSCHGKLHIKGRKPNAKLSRDDVDDIRNLHLLGYYNAELARVFKVDRGSIGNIINNKTWR